MKAHNDHHLPTVSQLLKATAIALLAAAAILVTAVLPSEYGIDPTGIGKAIGLTGLSATDAEAAKMPAEMTLSEPAAIAAEATISKSGIPLRTEEISMTLAPGEGSEVKATMTQGEKMVYSWSAEGGPVNVDMHGEKKDAGDIFTSYWKQMQLTGDQGSFVAPFDGTHGWYWRNRGDKPVTVKVKASGFYMKLARVK